MEYVSQQQWESTWQRRARVKYQFDLYEDVARHLPQGDGVSFLEVGCAPGKLLVEFCAPRGYEAYGIDYAADAGEIEEYLRGEGVRVGGVYREDFMKFDPGRRFDVVASFGFIEHFDDPGPVVDRHFDLVKPGGLVVITMPHFAGGQRALHWLLDRPNLKRHNTRCMNLPFLRAAAARNGAREVDVRYAGGHFDFWVASDRHWIVKGLTWRAALQLRRAARLLPGENNRWFSPHLLAIYQR